MLKQPLIIPISKKMYKVIEPYEYTWSCNLKRKHKIVVPEGFEYNGASVPRVAWTISGLRPDGLIRAGALVHDFLYRYVGNPPPENHLVYADAQEGWKKSYWEFSRKEADRLFLKMMKQAGMGVWRRSTAYRFVRCFAWVVWAKKMRG